ncbi:MAG: hypothetical protein ACLTYN_16305 [Dysosmobacter welbionis]
MAGWVRKIDPAAGLEADGTPTVLVRRNILEGYYQRPPTSRADNLRWSNVIVDLMVPQRTLLGGWCMVIPCFYLLYTVFVRASALPWGSSFLGPCWKPAGMAWGEPGRWLFWAYGPGGCR